ncbi:hypothetical protein [Pantoea ananatis]|uniref:hypothetical protein n=1 Tax=Pantoea ananas TaxID=553 RepID=UPI0011A4F067|nr:hypothetical protein [Pantoea ananatis]
MKNIINKNMAYILLATRKVKTALYYLIRTKDFKGFMQLFKANLYNFIGSERIWAIRSLTAKIDKNFNKNRSKIHFLTFYTQGEPLDHGMNLSKESEILLHKILPFVDSVSAVSASQLKNNPETSIYVKEFEEEAIWNHKTNKIGFLRWKPYIILKELENMQDNDILYYRDCNCTKYPNILADLHNTRKNIEHVLSYVKSDIFTPIELFPRLKIKHNVKTEVLERCNVSWKAENYEHFLHNASIFICRKTPEVIEFLNKWLELCMDDALISPTVSKAQHPDFLHNTQEQAIMNGLLLKNNDHENFSTPLGLSIIDRLFSANRMTKVPRVAILYCGQLRNFDNPELLEMNFRNILSKFNCDIFASVWDARGYSFQHGEAVPAKYSQDTDISVEKLKNILSRPGCKVRDVEIENFDQWLEVQDPRIINLYNEGLRFGEKVVKATSFPQLYKIYKANQLKCKFELANNFKYDLVIRFRPDMGFIESIPENYLNDELNFMKSSSDIYHLNPPKIFYPDRIYDILFWGNSKNMDAICDSWTNINNLLDSDFDNGLPSVDCCRLLYLQAKNSHLNVIDVPRCIGDIYRDEPIAVYTDKILNKFN